MSTRSPTTDSTWSLSSKLMFLRERLTRETGKAPTVRDLAARTVDESGKPSLDHTVIHHTLNGSKANPPCRTIVGLGQAFECPPAFLLPGPQDLDSLEVYYGYEQAREALRLVAELGESGVEGLLQAAHALRAARGLKAAPDATPPRDDSRKPRRRGRLSRAEAAEASRQEIQGLYS
ncbi:hypothetical protein [Kitasatospora purpeofusca]|uniref:hypothetical protein n=1 Tax=Kitasatospora purpeofusca TaxID=67352 RepID=UPI002A5A39E1|nr:hypothetical protein [Kitasatospora purpeofusca]MDY0816561.1 hypothetical protein [Kitasatospora purpeofusca]